MAVSWRSADDRRSAEIIARGFPVPGRDAPEELFVTVRLTDGEPEISPVMRR